MNKWIMLSLSAACLTGCYTERYSEREKTVQVPSRIDAIIKQELPHAQILGVEEGTFAGDWFYNVHYLDNGQHSVFRVSDEGTVTSTARWDGTIREAAGAQRPVW